MTIKRLRSLPDEDELRRLYSTPHDHLRYGRGHCERVATTIAAARLCLPERNRQRVIDLSCGNGEIARRIVAPGGDVHLGDLFEMPAMHGTPGEYGYVGPIEQTVHKVMGRYSPAESTFVLSETLEHLDDPAEVLRLAAFAAWFLVLSTPIDCWDDANDEHLWAWDREGVESILGPWAPETFIDLDTRPWGEPYRYGIWVCVS